MAQETQPYRRSLSGSIGSGMKSIFGGGGRSYYMLVHKVSSKYHKAGESQPIIVDEIELGRGSQCQVRFDDSFTTVSRRHAAIVKDGDKWKLVQLSTTNSTYLNGQKVHKEWYLQNGDEIQLSTNGPKLGFIIPEGEKGKISSIGLTARLNLFRKQALRPYRTALTVLSSILVLVIAGLVWTNIYYPKQLKESNHQIAYLMGQREGDSLAMDSLNRQLAENVEKLQKSQSEIRSVRKELAATQQELRDMVVTVPTHALAEFAKSTYFLQIEVLLGGMPIAGGQGTGFLLEDGRFVTAQHCVNFDSREITALMDAFPNDISFKLMATSPNDSFEMKYSLNDNPFHWGKYNYQTSQPVEIGGVFLPARERVDITDYRDYAWCQTNKKGSIQIDPEYSTKMPVGTKLNILGYPMGEGNRGKVDPLFVESTVAVNGLNDFGCIQLDNSETDHGNSGGPVFTVHDGKPVCVGILSGATRLGALSGSRDGKWKDRVVPISMINK